MTTTGNTWREVPPIELAYRNALESLIYRVFSAPFAKVFSSPIASPGAVAASKLLISDTFTDTNGVLLSNHTIAPTNTPAATWTYQAHPSLPGTFDIQNNVVNNVTAGKVPEYYLNAGVADCIIEIDFTTHATVNLDTYQIDVIFRNTDNANLWYVGKSTAQVIELREVTAGTSTQRVANVVTFVKNTAYHFKITLNGSSITCDLSGGATSQLTYTSSVRATVTNHGLLCYGAVANTVIIDNFTINNL